MARGAPDNLLRHKPVLVHATVYDDDGYLLAAHASEVTIRDMYTGKEIEHILYRRHGHAFGGLGGQPGRMRSQDHLIEGQKRIGCGGWFGVGLGSSAKVTANTIRQAAAAAAKSLRKSGHTDYSLHLGKHAGFAGEAAEGVVIGSYQFEQFKAADTWQDLGRPETTIEQFALQQAKT